LLVVGSLLLSDFLSSSATGGLEQSLNRGMQGISKLGRLGNSQITAVRLGRFQITDLHDIDRDVVGCGRPGCCIVLLRVEDVPFYHDVSTGPGIAGDQ
jgi:hypothetical protein